MTPRRDAPWLDVVFKRRWYNHYLKTTRAYQFSNDLWIEQEIQTEFRMCWQESSRIWDVTKAGFTDPIDGAIVQGGEGKANRMYQRCSANVGSPALSRKVRENPH